MSCRVCIGEISPSLWISDTIAIVWSSSTTPDIGGADSADSKDYLWPFKDRHWLMRVNDWTRIDLRKAAEGREQASR